MALCRRLPMRYRHAVLQLLFLGLWLSVTSAKRDDGHQLRAVLQTQDLAASRSTVGSRHRRSAKSPKAKKGKGGVTGLGEDAEFRAPEPKAKPCPKGMGKGKGMSADDCDDDGMARLPGGGHSHGKGKGKSAGASPTANPVVTPPGQPSDDPGVAGAIGDACEFDSDCGPGLFCLIFTGANGLEGSCAAQATIPPVALVTTHPTAGPQKVIDQPIITEQPTPAPTPLPSSMPTPLPSSMPTPAPSSAPVSSEPTASPSSARPTASPSAAPSGVPSANPTDAGSSGSCATSCGGQSSNGECFCDAVCTQNSDCCSDFNDHCSLPPTEVVPQNPIDTTTSGARETTEPFLSEICSVRILTGLTSDIGSTGPTCDIGETFIDQRTLATSRGYTDQDCSTFTLSHPDGSSVPMYISVSPQCKQSVSDPDSWEVCSWQPNVDHVLCNALGLECCDPISNYLPSLNGQSDVSCQSYTEASCGYFYGLATGGAEKKFTLNFESCAGPLDSHPVCPLVQGSTTASLSSAFGATGLIGIGFVALAAALALRRRRFEQTHVLVNAKADVNASSMDSRGYGTSPVRPAQEKCAQPGLVPVTNAGRESTRKNVSEDCSERCDPAETDPLLRLQGSQ